MSLYNTTSIKNLPQVDQIIDTDFLVVENYTGTNKLKFKDFVIGPTNASFYTSFKTNISELSAKSSTLNKSLTSLNSDVQSLSSFALSNKQEIQNTQNTAYNDFMQLSAAFDDLAFNQAATAVNILGTFESIFNSYEGLKVFINQVHHRTYPLRWDATSPGTSPTVSTYSFNILWPYELIKSDLIYVGPLVGINDSYNYNGTLAWSLSTLFFYGASNYSTYLVSLTSNIAVPDSMRAGYIPPGGLLAETTPTFAIRVFAAVPLDNVLT